MKERQVTFTMRLPESFQKRVKILAIEKGVSVKDLFVQCMEKLIEEEARKKK